MEEYLHIDWEKLSSLMQKPSWVFDTRGLLKEGFKKRNWISGK